MYLVDFNEPLDKPDVELEDSFSKAEDVLEHFLIGVSFNKLQTCSSRGIYEPDDLLHVVQKLVLSRSC